MKITLEAEIVQKSDGEYADFMRRQRQAMCEPAFGIASPLQFLKRLHTFHSSLSDFQLVMKHWHKLRCLVLLVGFLWFYCLFDNRSFLILFGLWFFLTPFVMNYWQATVQDLRAKEIAKADPLIYAVMKQSLMYWDTHPLLVFWYFCYRMDAILDMENPMIYQLIGEAQADLNKIQHINNFLEDINRPQWQRDEVKALATSMNADFLKPYEKREFVYQEEVYNACLDKILSFN